MREPRPLSGQAAGGASRGAGQEARWWRARGVAEAGGGGLVMENFTFLYLFNPYSANQCNLHNHNRTAALADRTRSFG